ncbi:MAG: hypothetical protein IPK69_07225 [Phycisphaerales bacterium]|nr:MAG: hypothetical protein IPK69_07225 [Phycisphaerales bacterium]
MLALVVSRLGAFAVLFAGMVLFSALGIVEESDTRHGEVTRTMFHAVQAARSEAFFGLSLIGVIALLVHVGRTTMADWSPVAVIFLLLGMFDGVLDGYHKGSAARVGENVVGAVVSIVPLAMLLPAMFRTTGSVRAGMRAVGWVGLAWAVGVVLQLGVNRAGLTLGQGGRFRGLLGNPQHAGVYLAMTLTVCSWLMVNESTRRWRLLWALVGGACGIMIVWTGSRTSALMGLIGLAAVFYSRIGRLILFAPAIGIGVFGGLQLLESFGVVLTADRLVSTDNTRAGAWTRMIESASDSPIMGNGTAFAGSSENSLMLAVASYGVGSGLLMLALYAAMAVMWLKYLIVRWSLHSDERNLGDTAAGLMFAYFVGSNFEGYGVARVSVMSVFLVFSASILHMVIQTARSRQLTTEEPAEHNQSLEQLHTEFH